MFEENSRGYYTKNVISDFFNNLDDEFQVEIIQDLLHKRKYKNLLVILPNYIINKKDEFRKIYLSLESSEATAIYDTIKNSLLKDADKWNFDSIFLQHPAIDKETFTRYLCTKFRLPGNITDKFIYEGFKDIIFSLSEDCIQLLSPTMLLAFSEDVKYSFFDILFSNQQLSEDQIIKLLFDNKKLHSEIDYKDCEKDYFNALKKLTEDKELMDKHPKYLEAIKNEFMRGDNSK